MKVSQSRKIQEFTKFLQVQSQKPPSAMMKLSLMRTTTGKTDPELPLLQRISSLELTAPQIAAQINASQISSNRLSPHCVVPTMKHGGGGGDTVSDLTSMATTAFCRNTPSRLVCAQWDYHLFFNRTMTQNTGYLTKQSDRVLHQMTWPPQSTNFNPVEMIWSEGKAANKCSEYVGTPSRLLEKHSS